MCDFTLQCEIIMACISDLPPWDWVPPGHREHISEGERQGTGILPHHLPSLM